MKRTSSEGQDSVTKYGTQLQSTFSSARDFWAAKKQCQPAAILQEKQVQSLEFTHAVVQLLSHVWLFATPRTAARQAPVFHRLLDFAQTCVHGVGDAVQPSHPLSSPSSPALSLSQHQGLLPLSRLFASDDQRTGASASASVLPMNIQGWFPLGLTGLISLLSNGLSSLL